MKILIVSDTHGKDNNLLKTIEMVSPIDLLIHLGDFESGEEYIKYISPCPVEMVSGNNDFFNDVPKEKMIYIGRYKVMLTHGHRYGVNYSTYNVVETAKYNNADIVMFGHTHIPMINCNDKTWIINPGSLELPRQTGRVPTFIIMDLDAKGEAHFTLNYCKDKMK